MPLHSRIARVFLPALVLLALVSLVSTFLPPAHAAVGILVNTTADNTTGGDTSCTLREAITNANSGSDTTGGDCQPGNVGADIIHFSVSGTITLGSSLPAIDDDVTIDGAAQTITVDGANAYQIMVVNSSKTLNLSALTIANGNCTGCSGGGIQNFGTLNVTDATFENNGATNDGGAIYNVGTTTVTGSTFVGNAANTGGGGISTYINSLIVSNSTFYNNSSSVAGGAIQSYYGTAIVTNSTVYDNTWGGFFYGGGGISSIGGTITLFNTIVANNTGGDCYADAGSGGVVTADAFNIDGDGSCDAATTSGSINLAALADNGGPTQTMKLQSPSDAINAGDNTVCGNAVGDPDYGAGGVDQRGVLRPQNTTCDVGAYELLFCSPGTFDNGSATCEPAPAGYYVAVHGATSATPCDPGYFQSSMGAMLCNQATAGNYVPTAASTTQTPCPSGSNSGVGASVCFQTGPSFVVNDASDTDDTACDALPGDCTLREAITAANNQAGANTITFDIPDDAGALCSADNVCTITLGALGTLPAIDDEVTIDGAPNNGDITVSGDNAVTVMTVNNGKTLSVNALTIVNGDTIGNGGGIFNGTGTLNVTNSTFSGNSAAFNGGAILNNGGTVNVTTSTFSDNSTTTAGAGNGGAIYNYSGTMNVMNSTFSGNSATNHGGGIYNEGTLNVTNSTFSGNSAAQGIGTYNRGTGNTVNVTNSTFSANTGTVSTSTVIFNQSGAGTTTLKNTIVAGNTVNFNCGYTPGGIAADSHNLVDFACDGAAIVGSIHLGPLQDNGGPTQTMALANNSPAIDAGDDTVCADNALPTSVNSLDQRGELRDDLNCDVGAFELRYGTTPPNSNTVTVQYNANNTRHSFGPALAIITPTTGAPIDFTVTITPSLYTTPVPPANALPIQWDARASTSPFSAFVTLCYDPGVLTGQDETTLHLYHYNGSTWVEFGGVLDNTTYAPDYHCIASATPLTSLSPLALAPNAPTATNVTGVKGLVNKNDNIVLRWKTTTETQIAGFNIYRQGKQGEWKQINAKFRQAKHAGAALGDKYRFIDRKANADKTYRYKIEIVYLDGHTEWTQVIRVNKP